MKLSDQIEEMRQSLLASHPHNLELARSLGAELHRSDAELMRELEAVFTAQEARANDIVGMLRRIASRIGHVPAIEADVAPMPRVLRKVA